MFFFIWCIMEIHLLLYLNDLDGRLDKFWQESWCSAWWMISNIINPWFWIPIFLMGSDVSYLTQVWTKYAKKPVLSFSIFSYGVLCHIVLIGHYSLLLSRNLWLRQ
jgi:hypothetical protein